MTKLEEKQKELIDYLKGFGKHIPYVKDLLAEISELDQETRPVYDEAYLNECIRKAKPNLSKIKDIDKALDEIRGVSEITDADIEAWVLDYKHAPHPDYVALHTVDVFRTALVIGAKAMKDKEIKHIEK
jgi:rRNA maturation endonuclease Nob1